VRFPANSKEPALAPDHGSAEALARVRAAITPRTRITVLSGAGISASSGIPTFRGGDDALWSRYRPEELATPQAFARDPELVWRWYDWRRGLIAAAAPNEAHLALAALQDQAQVTLVTQNVDGLHQRAGSRDVIEFHGSIWTLRCTGCAREDHDDRVPLPIPPRCEGCGALLRPGVVWFGEGIDPETMGRAAAAAGNCEMMVVVGTAGAVYPAAGLVTSARRSGARILEFNLEPGGVTHLADLFFAGDAAATLPGLVP
jgi:NAD-dependent deacetylase